MSKRPSAPFVHERPHSKGFIGYEHMDIHAALGQPDLEWAAKNHCLAGALGEVYKRAFGGAPMRATDIEENWLGRGERPGSAVLFHALFESEEIPADELASWSAATLGAFHRFLGVASVEASAARSFVDEHERRQEILGIARMLEWLAHPVTPEHAAEMVKQMREWGMPVIDFLKTGHYVVIEESEDAA